MGAANVLLRYLDKKQGRDDMLYRCCVRYASLQSNNELTVENYQYVSQELVSLLGDLIVPVELVALPLVDVEDVLRRYISDVDATVVMCFRIRNMLPPGIYQQEAQFDDHFTKVYCDDQRQHILLEIKPKWLHRDPLFCRNCTHNVMKGRDIRYCYSLLVDDPDHIITVLNHTGLDYPENFVKALRRYLLRNDNVLKVLRGLQESLERITPIGIVSSISDVTPELLLNMTLRDVTCFIEWHGQDPSTLNVHVVDVDRKPIEKWEHWVKIHSKLYNCKERITHT